MRVSRETQAATTPCRTYAGRCGRDPSAALALMPPTPGPSASPPRQGWLASGRGAYIRQSCIHRSGPLSGRARSGRGARTVPHDAVGCSPGARFPRASDARSAGRPGTRPSRRNGVEDGRVQQLGRSGGTPMLLRTGEAWPFRPWPLPCGWAVRRSPRMTPWRVGAVGGHMGDVRLPKAEPTADTRLGLSAAPTPRAGAQPAAGSAPWPPGQLGASIWARPRRIKTPGVWRAMRPWLALRCRAEPHLHALLSAHDAPIPAW